MQPLAEQQGSVTTMKILWECCFSQNKNIPVVSTLPSLVASRSAGKKLTIALYNFPYPGHSYLLPSK